MRSKYVPLIVIALIMSVILAEDATEDAHGSTQVVESDTINSGWHTGQNMLGGVEVLNNFDIYHLFSKKRG